VLTRRYESILCLIVLALAALLRLAPIASGLPYIDYVDEGYALHQAIELLNKRTFDPGWHGYPSLPAYLTAGTLIIEGPIYRRVHGHGFRKDLPREDRAYASQRDDYDLISPPELIIAGRFVAVALSIGTVILAGVIATRLGGKTAGILALLITAVCPALVSRASNVIVDTFATFFALLALYFCERLWSNKSSNVANAVVAGLAAGLAVASKYTAGAVFIAVLAVIWTLPVTRSSRARFMLLASAGLLIGIAVGAPATILKLPAVMRDVAITASNYGIINSSPGYFGQAVSGSELGWPLTIAGCAGIVFMFRRKSTRSTALSWSLFVLLLLAIFLGKPFQAFRNLLPLVPLLCIAAAIVFSDLIDWARRGAPPWLRFGLTVALIGGCVVSLGFSSFRQAQRRMAHPDTRIQAIDWLQQHAAKEERILGIRELAILPAEWKRLAASSTVVSWFEASDLLEREQFDYVVTGDLDLRYAPDADQSSAWLARWKQKTALLPAQADFGSVVTPVVPYLWRTNDERILILRKTAAPLF
jgi:dolichyl-phosphate-mannose-protein mannosyltransferase/glycosyl transferase family 22 (putative mannosyltransferase)